MINNNTRKFCNEVINHPYVLLKILPFVGDFAGQARLLNRTLLAERVINNDQFVYTNSLVNLVERSENMGALRELIGFYKRIV